MTPATAGRDVAGRTPVTAHERRAGAGLLLACVRRGGDPAEIRRQLRAGVDWWRLLDEARRQDLSSRVYAVLRTIPDGTGVPPDVMERLGRAYYRQAALNGQLFHELRTILTACARTGISVLLLKGAAIAPEVYGNIALRPMRDLDLLVSAHDLEAMDRLLRQLGYAPDASDPALEWPRDAHHHVAPYHAPDGRAVVEVHRHILSATPSIRISIEDLWRRARPAVTGDAVALCPEDLLLHLCLHVAVGHHFSIGLRPICDIAETIRYYGDDIDWEQVRHRAGEWSATRFVHLTLCVARELVEAAVPDDVLDSLRPPGFDRRLVGWATARIFADEHDRAPVTSNLAQLRGPKRVRDKGTLLLRRVFPAPEVMGRLYPASSDARWIYLYYPRRWWDLVRRYGGPAWHLLRRDEATMALAEEEIQKTALREWLATPR